MGMNRRSFLTRLGAAAAGALALTIDDPERLLWVPGQKTFFLPPEKPALLTDVADVQRQYNQFRSTEAEVVRQQLKTGIGVHEVYTGVGVCMFDKDWNLLTVRGEQVTVEQAARLQAQKYTFAGHASPDEVRRLTVELHARRKLAGLA